MFKRGNSMEQDRETKVRVITREFQLPIVKDILILGSNTAIGPVAMGKALEILHVNKFVKVDGGDDIISTVFIRETIVLKTDKDRIINFLKKRIKPLMTSKEMIQIDMDLEITIEAEI